MQCLGIDAPQVVWEGEFTGREEEASEDATIEREKDAAREKKSFWLEAQAVAITFCKVYIQVAAVNK